MLNADISKCFDTIDHDKLLAKIDTFPQLRNQIKAWLRSGVFDKGAYSPTRNPSRWSNKFSLVKHCSAWSENPPKGLGGNTGNP